MMSVMINAQEVTASVPCGGADLLTAIRSLSAFESRAAVAYRILQRHSCEGARSDDWATHNAAGKALARAYVEEARADGETITLFGVIRDLMEIGRKTGFEIGFAQGIAEACL